MNIVKRLSLTIGVTTLITYMTVGHAVAAIDDFCTENSTTFLGFPTWYKYLNPIFVPATDTAPAYCNLAFNFPGDLPKVGLAIVEILLRIGGLVAVGFVIYGGFNYITSQGEPDKTKSARQMIVNAIIGVAIATIATVAVAFVGREFTRTIPS